MLKKPQTVKALEELGRVQLSPSFFMRDFLYSEISQIERIPNIPNNPDLAIKVGKKLCVEILEPIQNKLGKISIRSAYRSPKVNDKGANIIQYNCAMKIVTLIFVGKTKMVKRVLLASLEHSLSDYYEQTYHWQALAWWILIFLHTPQCYFFPSFDALDKISAQKKFKSYIAKSGLLANFSGMRSYLRFLNTKNHA